MQLRAAVAVGPCPLGRPHHKQACNPQQRPQRPSVPQLANAAALLVPSVLDTCFMLLDKLPWPSGSGGSGCPESPRSRQHSSNGDDDGNKPGSGGINCSSSWGSSSESDGASSSAGGEGILVGAEAYVLPTLPCVSIHDRLQPAYFITYSLPAPASALLGSKCHAFNTLRRAASLSPQSGCTMMWLVGTMPGCPACIGRCSGGCGRNPLLAGRLAKARCVPDLQCTALA
jgi:hypothetical protein